MDDKKGFRWGLLITTALVLYLLYVIVSQQTNLDIKFSELKDIQAKIEEESNLNRELKNEEELLNTDEYIEKTAREKLGMIKPGERIFIDIN